MLTSKIDHSLFYDLLTKYYLLLDDLTDNSALKSWYTEDARWECSDFGSKQPEISLSIVELENYVNREGHLARAARLRHHITGLTTIVNGDGTTTSTAKVMVTQQPELSIPPIIREIALVNVCWHFDESQGEWRIMRWHIMRDSI